MATIGDEAFATLREAERLIAALPIGSKDREATEDIAADLREICRELTSLGPSAALRVRETVYGSQALLRVIAARHATR